jgi:hypothetical protein
MPHPTHSLFLSFPTLVLCTAFLSELKHNKSICFVLWFLCSCLLLSAIWLQVHHKVIAPSFKHTLESLETLKNSDIWVLNTEVLIHLSGM